ncbi:MAG: HAMP domain-containing histidine kinase [Clostridia bacterium]|nr:HAMP domain-containing histidine kinase [Clostridia bacterium]
MTELVNDLLSLSRLDNEKDKDEIEDLNLTEELYKTCEVYKKYIEGKGLTLKSDIDKNVTFTCHPGKIKQLINILLDNAIKYNKENGEVKIILKKSDYTFNLIVKDTGIGIKKEEIPNVFDRFFRSDSSRSTTGTGLGLAIAYGIVKSHFGTIKVNSEVGKGTEFIVTFPYDINNK